MSYLDEVVADFNRQMSVDLETAIDNFNYSINNTPYMIDEAEYTRTVEHLKLEILDIDRFVKVNECRAITNPVFYSRDNIPTSDGLLSNEIFGITQADRAGIFAYIDLGQYFIDPSCYKAWTKIDSKIREVVHKTDTFSISPKGEIVQDPNGKNGVKFLKDNIDKIVFKTSESLKRDLKVRYLESNRKKMFINKYLVIPPYYRDTNTGKRSVGVGGINKYYNQLLIAVNAQSVTQDYGFDMSGANEGRIQEIIIAIYDWFAGNANGTIQTTDVGVGISGKTGILRRANLSKTVNYSARLVMSASDAKVNKPEDLMVNYDYSAVPLHAAMACFRPFVQFWVRRFFESMFTGTETYPVLNSDGTIKYVVPKDPLIQFSDERIVDEMEKFIHSKNNRFRSVKIRDEENKEYTMYFKAGVVYNDNIDNEEIFQRPLTWCDIFYQATVMAVKNRMVLITRYPVDSMYNKIATKVRVSSTKETSPVYYNGELYKYYPKINIDEIDKDTGNKFIDTLRISNIYIKGMCLDYDGDTASITGLFTDEANEEVMNFMNDKMNFVNLASGSTRSVSASGAATQSLYNLTLILPADKDKLKEVEL